MSGTPAGSPTGTAPVWNVLPWHSAYLDVRDYQWNDVAIPFWRKVQEHAAEVDVKVCIEMHPHNIVYNPATMHRLATEIDATHVGAEMDPSHLFWQGIEPIEAIEQPGRAGLPRGGQGHPDQPGRADQRRPRRPLRPGPARRRRRHRPRRALHAEPLARAGVLGLRGRRSGPRRGWWRRFLAALAAVDPDMAVNIEHEDQELDQLEGLRTAAATLLAARARVAIGSTLRAIASTSRKYVRTKS